MTNGGHPVQHELALFAASDLSGWRNWRIGRHVRSCEECRKEAERYRSARMILAESAGEMPEEVHWNRMSAEIKANIHLGLEAGQIAGPMETEPVRPMGWRAAAALASLAILTVSGWWLQTPRFALDSEAIASQRVILKSTRSGIEVEENGRSLSLVHRESERATMTVNMQGTLRAHYVDDETGGVTIHQVYVE